MCTLLSTDNTCSVSARTWNLKTVTTFIFPYSDGRIYEHSYRQYRVIVNELLHVNSFVIHILSRTTCSTATLPALKLRKHWDIKFAGELRRPYFTNDQWQASRVSLLISYAERLLWWHTPASYDFPR